MRSRVHLPAEERQILSQLHRLLNEAGIMRGCLVPTRHRCGKPGCRCAKGPYRHRAVYVSQSHKGKLRMRCVPKGWEDRVREWVGRHRQVRELVERLSEMYWQRLIERKD